MNITVSLILLAGISFGYICGSVSTAIIVCKLMRLPDPRSQGSGNPGATNVLRIGGKKAAMITLLGDAIKGFVPVIVASVFLLSLDHTPETDISWLPAIAGLGAFIGHLYPVFFNFKGGKGVATALGVLAGISWPVFLSVCIVWLAMAFAFRYSALAALTGFALAPAFSLFFLSTWFPACTITMMSILIFIRHTENIKRLINGTEGKIGNKK